MLRGVTTAHPAPGVAVSARTRRSLVESSGGLAAASVAAMSERLPWFRRLSADQRADVLLVTQAGVTNFAAWLAEPGETIRLTAEAFRNAPRDLARRVSLRQTVELVRVAIEVFEQHLPMLARDDREHRLLVEGILRFGREIAFAAATVYAGAAESRGAWDARLEALVVDGVVRGEVDDALLSRSSALGWDAERPVTALVGSPPPEPDPDHQAEPLGAVRRAATRLGHSALLGVHGARLVALVSGALTGAETAGLAEAFGPGPVVVGPTAPSLAAAHAGARDALQGLRAVSGWALAGDPAAKHQLVASVVLPLRAAGGELTRTLACYLEGGGALESCARMLFVHANTVRYRLRRVSEVTGLDPTDARHSLVLRIALVVGRLSAGEPVDTRTELP
jgi:DNA-binding PucR family transcriptional regulator